MQRGIDSFFKKITPQNKDKIKDDEQPKSSVQRKRKARVISSDEEEDAADVVAKSVRDSPKTAKSHEHKKTCTEKDKTRSSPKSAKTPSLSKLKSSPKKPLKSIDPTTLFGGETLRVEAKKAPRPKDAALMELDDDEINQSLMEVDVDKNITENTNEGSSTNGVGKEDRKRDKSKTPNKSSHKSSKSPHKEKSSEDKMKTEQKPQKSESKNDKKSPRKSSKSPRKEKSPQDIGKDNIKAEKITPPTNKKSKLDHDESMHRENDTTPKSVSVKKEKSTPKPIKKEHVDLESSILTDEERHERKRMTAMLYQKYKNRASCINPGSKEVPKGKPNCLAGLTFLVTGVLESLERDEAGSIIKELGGKVMSTVGKRLNYMIVGEEAGPKKLVQAEELGVSILSEDDFLNLIRKKSGQGIKSNGKSAESPSSTSSPRKVKKEDTKNKKKNHETPEKKIKIEKSPIKEELNNNNHKNHDEVKIKQENLNEVKEEKITHIKTEVDDSMLAWVDKYKPTSIKEIVGQFGAASNVTKLTNWLTKWYTNHDGKKKLQKPSPWAKNDDGSFYKAALLSGPPGIGKTTTATLVCKELGFDAVEFNASDTRSKRLLKEEVSELLSNKSLYGYFHGSGQAVTKKHVLIMDEVDGMAGNEDRGGIQELIGLIKDSSVPIVCMCNDRNHQKMRSLVNYCYDLRFSKPRLEQIKGRILSICFKEKFKIEPSKVEEIITATNNDIRQSINHISLLSAGKDLQLKSTQDGGDGEKTAEKDLKMGPWEVVRKVFSADDHKKMSFYDKCDLFFHDYSLSPLFVQQNYLQVSPCGPKSEVMKKVALTADALSLGDLVDKRIRSNMAWSLLPTQAVFSSVMPGEYMCGHFTGQINFPGWLGKNSRYNKRSRLAQEIHDHTRLRTSGSRQSIRLDYAPYLLANIVRPLREQGMEGITASLDVIKDYHLLREDIDSLIELTTWPAKKGLMDAVDGRVKAALTRTYNKEVLAYTYSATAGVKKKRAEANDDADGLEVQEIDGETVAAVAVSDDENDEDNLENDGLIKAKKKPAATSKASSSKAKTTTSSKKSSTKASTSKAKK